MDRNDRLAASGTSNHDVGATLPKPNAPQVLDLPKHLAPRHSVYCTRRSRPADARSDGPLAWKTHEQAVALTARTETVELSPCSRTSMQSPTTTPSTGSTSGKALQHSTFELLLDRMHRRPAVSAWLSRTELTYRWRTNIHRRTPKPRTQAWRRREPHGYQSGLPAGRYMASPACLPVPSFVP